MNLFKILLIKLFRDIFKNFKQFLSIIFIVCISVTLYVGLDANAQNFENRINEVYEETNIADEWITINPKFNNSSEMESDFEFIESQVSKESGGAIEKRFYIPTNIGSTLTNAIILDKLPDINRPYNLETIDYDRNNFFFVDRALIKRYEENNNVDFELGDSLPVNINANYIKSMIDSLLSDSQFLSETISGIIDDSNIDIVYKNFLKEIITNNADEISKFSKDLFAKNFNVEVVSLDLGVNGIMSHPENMDNGELSTSSYLLSNRLLFNSLLDFVHSHIDIQNVISFIRESFENFTSNEEIMNLVDKLLTYLENEENENLIEEAIDNIFIDFKNTINARNVDSIEQFFDCFYNQIVAKLGLNVKSEDFENSINEYFSNKEENNLLIVLSRNNYPNLMSVENDINQAKQLTLVFPTIFFVVAILIVLTTVSSLVLKDRVQIGTLKAIGVKRSIIGIFYLIEMNVVTLIGTLLGFIIGPLLLPYIMNIKYSILYSIPNLTYFFPFLTAFVVLIVVISLVSFITILMLYKELKLEPSESMRSKTPHQWGLSAHKHIIKNTSYMMAIRNIKVHFIKSLMVIIGVMGCTGLLICGMGIDDTINYGKNSDLEKFFNSDISLTLNGSLTFEEAKTDLLNFDGVEDAEGYAQQRLTVNSESKAIQADAYIVSKNSNFFKFDDYLENGNWKIDGIGISEAKAEDLGVQIGDIVSFELNGQLLEKEVSAIFYTFFVNGIFIYQESVTNIIDSCDALWIDVDEGADSDKIKDQILNNYDLAYSCLTRQDMETRIDGYMSSVSMMTNTVKVFAILLAVVVLINLSILNYNERSREIATLKVLGFSRSRIVASLLIEMLILTCVGALIGLSIGLPMEYLVLSVNETNLVSWKYFVAGDTYIISLIISILTALVVNLFMFFKVNSISMSESLKSVDE